MIIINKTYNQIFYFKANVNSNKNIPFLDKESFNIHTFSLHNIYMDLKIE